MSIHLETERYVVDGMPSEEPATNFNEHQEFLDL